MILNFHLVLIYIHIHLLFYYLYIISSHSSYECKQTCELVNLNMISKRKGKIKRERFSSGLHSSVTYLFRRCTN